MSSVRILLTGGGTGGHIYPALTIADEIRRLEPEAEFLYVGSERGLEADLVRRAGLPFAGVSAGALVGVGLRGRLRGLWRTGLGTLQALGHVRRFRPHAVLATGGFVSGPVLAAAWMLRVPIALWEGNAFPGVTVRLFSRIAGVVFIPYPEARRHFPPGARLVAFGNPVRRAVLEAQREPAREALGLPAGAEVVLAFGGSQGGRGIHQALVPVAARLLERPRFHLIHVTGARQFDEVDALYRSVGLAPEDEPRLRLLPYLHEMPLALAAADVAVTRAGATTMAEIAARGLPAVVIPFPHATHGHQEHNARALARRGGVLMFREAELAPERLYRALTELLDDPARRDRMARALRAAAMPDAGERIARRVLEVAGRGVRTSGPAPE